MKRSTGIPVVDNIPTSRPASPILKKVRPRATRARFIVLAASRDERTCFDLVPRLSKREAEVLACVARGHTNPEIGALLGITTDTVKSHLKNLLNKLGAINRTEAVMIATKHGLLGL